MNDINSTPQGLDGDSILVIVGVGFVGAGLAALGQVPGVRAAIGNIAASPELKELGRKALGVVLGGLGDMLSRPGAITVVSPLD